MAPNIRKSLSSKKDRELVRIHAESLYPQWKADSEYKEGGASIESAQMASDGAEVATVAAAVIKERVEKGGEGSHSDLQDISVKPSKKRIDREFGHGLSERRGG